MKKFIAVVLSILGFILVDLLLGILLEKGLNRYFGLNKDADILLVGHSHLMLATDKKMLEDSLGLKVSKYCREGVDVVTRDIMLRHYLSQENVKYPKVVIYGVDQYMFNPNGLSDNVYKLFYPFMDNPHIDSYIKDNAKPVDYFTHKLIKSSRFDDALFNSSIRGWTNNWSNYKIGKIDSIALQKNALNKNLRPITVDSIYQKTFESDISMLTDKGITVVLLNTPIVKEYNESDPDNYKNIINYFKSLAKENTNVLYWDLNPEYSDRYELFYDPIHLNILGQQVISREIINLYRHDFNSDTIIQQSTHH